MKSVNGEDLHAQQCSTTSCERKIVNKSEFLIFRTGASSAVGRRITWIHNTCIKKMNIAPMNFKSSMMKLRDENYIVCTNGQNVEEIRFCETKRINISVQNIVQLV
ncbi:hypothetical protein DINM_006307 [Dirofilaria immitis]|nr:hypothetical protein [Dirofilaria immitis]